MTALPSTSISSYAPSAVPIVPPPQLKVTGRGSLEADMSPGLCQFFLGTTTYSQHCSRGANWAWQPAPSIPEGNLSGQKG